MTQPQAQHLTLERQPDGSVIFTHGFTFPDNDQQVQQYHDSAGRLRSLQVRWTGFAGVVLDASAMYDLKGNLVREDGKRDPEVTQPLLAFARPLPPHALSIEPGGRRVLTPGGKTPTPEQAPVEAPASEPVEVPSLAPVAPASPDPVAVGDRPVAVPDLAVPSATPATVEAVPVPSAPVRRPDVQRPAVRVETATPAPQEVVKRVPLVAPASRRVNRWSTVPTSSTVLPRPGSVHAPEGDVVDSVQAIRDGLQALYPVL